MGIYIKGRDFYPAKVRRSGASFQADFLDIPGCHGYGATAIEAEVSARQALGAHMATLGSYGRTLPAPSTIVGRARSSDSYLVYIEGPERVDSPTLPVFEAA